MKLYYYRGKYPNFGDDLNTWLLPKVFPDFFDADEAVLFLGIGSIIHNAHPVQAHKIVFGSGYGGYTMLPERDSTWSVYCVRGPRTARVWGLGPETVAGDAAILINLYRRRAPRPSIQVSFIPHWESLERGRWEAPCHMAGIHLIDPRLPVEQVLGEIEQSELVIAEAMHGAIVADALRVPWIPALPLHPGNRFKWFDWAEALNLTLSPNRLAPSSVQEAAMSILGRHSHSLERGTELLRKITFGGLNRFDAAFAPRAAASLRAFAKQEPILSSDQALARAIERLESNAARVRKDFARAGAAQVGH